MRNTLIQITLLVLAVMSCTKNKYNTTGTIERLSPELDAILSREATIEIIAEGFEWSEGPLWIEDKKMLLFSDVPQNKIYQWTEQDGLKEYLSPSGFTGSNTTSREPGSNGLLLDDNGRLVLCQHGDRRLAVMSTTVDQPASQFTTIADRYDTMRFNSPNDAAFFNDRFYFTDPPYGLGKQMDDPEKETPFQGVYCVLPDGQVKLLIDSLTRPNGIAVGKDGRYLLVANSDPEKATWYRYELEGDSVKEGKVFYDATPLTASQKGLPDGLKIDSNGNVFASGPGGVWIFNAEGKVLGKIILPEAASNTALSGDEKTLFVTNDMYVLRIKMR